MSGDRVVAIFAHPDDESLLAGGTLAALADAGVETVVVCATRGEEGVHGPAKPPEATAAVREQELTEACRALGAAVECLGYGDGMLEDDRVRLEADLEGALRRWRPRAVLTFGPEGLYWHPDHVAVHEAAAAAAAKFRNGAAEPHLYYATVPDGLVPEFVAALRARGLGADLWGLDPSAFGAPEESITTVIDVRPQLSRKLEALRSHRSQLPEDNALRTVPGDLAERFLGREYFARAEARGGSPDWLLEAVRGGGRRVTCSRA